MITFNSILFAYKRLLSNGLTHNKITTTQLDRQMKKPVGTIGNFLRNAQKDEKILSRPFS